MARFTLTPAQLAELARNAGFDYAGIAAVEPGPGGDVPTGFDAWVEAGHAGEMEYLKRTDEAGRRLRSHLQVAFPWAQSVIVCASNYHHNAPLSIDASGPGSGWIARYAWSGEADGDGGARPTDYHDVLLARVRLLERELHRALGETFESRSYVDTGPIVERAYAQRAGLGWTGKNTCILSQERGSWFFLAVIVSSLSVASEATPLPAVDRCGSCRRCLDACPTGALVAPRQMDASLCISYLTIEKRGSIPEPLRTPVGRNVFGCDICQDVCPWNSKSPVSVDPALAPRPELINPSLEWLASLDAGAFNRLFRGSPVKRAKHAGMRRNVAIAMGNSGQPRYLARLRAWAAAGDDPVLAETAAWAIRQIEAAPASRAAADARPDIEKCPA